MTQPSDEQLARYFEGRLSYQEEAQLSEAIDRDPALRRRVEALEWTLSGLEDESPYEAPEALTQAALNLWPEPAPALMERAEEALKLMVRWVEDQLEAISPAPMLATGLVRGQASEELRYQMTVGEIPLEVDLEVDGPERFALFIRPIQTPPPGTLLYLSEGGQTKAISSLTSEGILVSALPIGAYELKLERSAEEIGALQIELLSGLN